jgi:hypothetical protein
MGKSTPPPSSHRSRLKLARCLDAGNQNRRQWLGITQKASGRSKSAGGPLGVRGTAPWVIVKFRRLGSWFPQGRGFHPRLGQFHSLTQTPRARAQGEPTRPWSVGVTVEFAGAESLLALTAIDLRRLSPLIAEWGTVPAGVQTDFVVEAGAWRRGAGRLLCR